jgi:K+-sensing histidine kinase KdpD
MLRVNRFKEHVPQFRHSEAVYGVALCTGAAALLAMCVRTTSLRVSVIFPFLLVVIFVAIRFGAVAAMVGSSVSAVVFSCFMLPPIGSFSIEDPVAKQNLLWFVVAGISLGYLFAPVPPDKGEKP